MRGYSELFAGGSHSEGPISDVWVGIWITMGITYQNGNKIEAMALITVNETEG